MVMLAKAYERSPVYWVTRVKAVLLEERCRLHRVQLVRVLATGEAVGLRPGAVEFCPLCRAEWEE